ncbi:hypothetical protein BFP97_14665 [Roseivirga sp. 4D4]|uniref:hypothetical protein n=1 Tax=Roseivirga sp. 4D4 TaxID=1889784 RepID=UPI000852DE56|nr:hypothetical protein [Roseivirga sp. 4D4]OEK02689.1 hypothetical protein BFP97_14665 [Roseivirga sp. 4D4]
MKKLLAFILVSLSLVSCGDQKIDTTKAREEMEDREIKVVSEAEIIERAMEIGNTLSKSFSIEVVPEPLTQTYVINTEFGPDSVYHKARYFFDDHEDLSGKVLQVFEAYRYNRDNNLVSEPNIQKLDESKMLYYTKPMFADTVMVGMWAIEIPRKNVVLSIKD